MKDALKIGCGIVNRFVVWALRRLAINKGTASLDGREEAFQKAKAKIDATEPSVHRPFIDSQHF